MWYAICNLLVVLSFFLSTYLTLRQRKTILRATEPPKIFKDKITDEKFQKEKAYQTDKINFALLQSVISFFLVLFKVKLIGTFWNFFNYGGEIIHSLIFLDVFDVIGTIIDLPFSYYSTFVIEEKYGFNKSTKKLWVTDILKSQAISLILTDILVPIIIFIFRKAGAKSVYIIQIVLVIIQLIMQVIYPILILPLFTKLTRITEGPVFEGINKLCEETKFNAKEVYSADDSKRTNHTNAMVFGLFTKKIAFADKFLEDPKVDQLVAIIAHEIGHSKHWHIFKQFIIAQIQFAIFFNVLYMFMSTDSIFIEFGVEDKPFIIGMFLFGILMSPIETLLDLPMNMLSRHFEYQADSFAAERNLPIDLALIDLATDNMDTIDDDPLYSAFTSSHPTIPQRVEAARAIMKKKE